MNPNLPKNTKPAACLKQSVDSEKSDTDDPVTDEVDQFLQVSESTDNRRNLVPTIEKSSSSDQLSSDDKENTNRHSFEDENLSIKSNDVTVASISENSLLGATSCIDCTSEDFEFHLQGNILLAYQHPLFKIEEEDQELYESDDKAKIIKSELSGDSNRSKRIEERDRRRRSLGTNKWSTEANYDSDESDDSLSSFSLSDVESKDLENDLDTEENFKLSVASGEDKNRMYQEEENKNDNNDTFTKDSFDSDDSDLILPSNGVQQHDNNKELVFDLDKYPETQGFRIEEVVDESTVHLGFLSCNNAEEIAVAQGASQDSSRSEINHLSLTEINVEKKIAKNTSKTSNFNVSISITDANDVDSLSDNCSSISSSSSAEDVSRSKSDIPSAMEKEVLSTTTSHHIKGTKNREIKMDSERMAEKQSNKYDDDSVNEISDNKEKTKEASQELQNQIHSQLDRYEKETGEKRDTITNENMDLNTRSGIQNSTYITGQVKGPNKSDKSNYDGIEYPYTPRNSVSDHQGDEVVFEEEQDKEEGDNAIDDFVNDEDIVSKINEKNVEKNESNEP